MDEVPGKGARAAREMGGEPNVLVTLGRAFKILFDDYILVISITLRILRHPIKFGREIGTSERELARALSYLTQWLIIIALFSRVELKQDIFGKSALSDLVPVMVAAYVLMLSVGGYFGALIVTGNSVNPAAIMAAYLYWYGIGIFGMTYGGTIGLVLIDFARHSPVAAEAMVSLVLLVMVIIEAIALFTFLIGFFYWLGRLCDTSPSVGFQIFSTGVLISIFAFLVVGFGGAIVFGIFAYLLHFISGIFGHSN